MKNKVAGFLFLFCLPFAGLAGGTYTNPFSEFGSAGDPDVIIYNETYYCYLTSRDMAVYTSKDLVHWEKGPQILPDNLKKAWAPEVYYHPEDGKFYLYYTMNYKIGVAVADRPDSMFTDLGFLTIPGIDAHMFRDDDGRLYLYFTHTPPFTMYCLPMKSPTVTGGPVTKCFEISQSWETNSFAVNEGPWMMKHDGKYSLLYSGSSGQSIYYAVGLASAATPIGPFTKYENNPVFQKLPEIYGPGHGSVTRDRAGKLWHLYQQKLTPAISWARDICLDPVSFDGNGILRGTPTRGFAQAVPVCDTNIVWSPDINPRGAFFKDRVEVMLTSMTSGAEIRYTIDGSEPTAKSKLFSKKLVLKKTTTVKAAAYKKGMQASAAVQMLFTRTDAAQPANPAPNAPQGDCPFDVFSGPVTDWTNHVVKPVNIKTPKPKSGSGT